MAASSRKSSGPVLPIASTFQRSISPSGRFASSSPSDSYLSSFASSTSSGFCSSPSTGFFHRSASPTRVNLHGMVPLAPSVKFSIDGSRSPRRSMSVSRDQVVRKQNNNPLSLPKKTFGCSGYDCPCAVIVYRFLWSGVYIVVYGRIRFAFRVRLERRHGSEIRFGLDGIEKIYYRTKKDSKIFTLH
ncbi:hypothetical protein F0562_012283 [Nyssa sinensis]|uniref:Uncharacterized protein n=1 Tax=Nyssa sinensis TaxID=561372 RepID=A0A5J4ZT53_9ASTE|nr:hypothetical protein F0562_012283 [Nyssa sinensis]